MRYLPTKESSMKVIRFLLGAILFVTPLHTKLNWARVQLARMSLRQKIAQLFIIPATAISEEQYESLASQPTTFRYAMDQKTVEQLITMQEVGGIIFLRTSTLDRQIALTNRYQTLSKIPLMVTQDLEWGLAMRLSDGMRFPRAMALAAIADKQLVFEVAREIGRQCRAIGVHWNFAPVVDIADRPDNPVTHDWLRAFSDDPAQVARCGTLFASGLAAGGVVASAKHFPGHGATSIDSHCDLPVISKDRASLEAHELVPFKALLAQGIPSVMTAHLHLPMIDDTEMATLSHKITTQLLRDELGYQGIIVTDALGMEAIAQRYPAATIPLRALQAGVDLLICPVEVPAAIDVIEQAVLRGDFSEELINQKVLKLLVLKEGLGLTQQVSVDSRAAKTFVARQEAKDLQQKVYRASITVAQDPQGLIPLLGHKNVTLKQRFLQVGGSPKNSLMAAVAQRMPSTHISASDSAKLAAFCATVRSDELVIIALLELARSYGQRCGISKAMTEQLTLLCARGVRVIMLVGGSPYSSHFLPQQATVVVGYESCTQVFDAFSELLVGQLISSGKLAVRLL